MEKIENLFFRDDHHKTEQIIVVDRFLRCSVRQNILYGLKIGMFDESSHILEALL